MSLIHSSARIHPSAVIDPSARLGENVEVGPFVVIEADVSLGAGCRIQHGAHIGRWTQMGEHNQVYPGAVIGHDPQDYGYKGEEAWTRIGDRNIFREGVSVHRGYREGTDTRIGSGNFFMVNSHVAHNCILGDNIILVNGALLAGHVEVGNKAIISGNCMVHQFARIGAYSMMRGGSGATKDVPPFCINDGISWLRGINTIGMRRAGFDARRIRAVKETFKTIFRAGYKMEVALEKVESALEVTEEVRMMLEFIRSSRRGVGSGRGSVSE